MNKKEKLMGKWRKRKTLWKSENWLVKLFLGVEAGLLVMFKVQIELTSLLNEKSQRKSVVKDISAVMKVWKQSRKTVERVRKKVEKS